MAAVQLARSHGMRVLGSAGSELGSQVVMEAGAHEVFNHKEMGYLDKVMVRIKLLIAICRADFRATSMVCENYVADITRAFMN